MIPFDFLVNEGQSTFPQQTAIKNYLAFCTYLHKSFVYMCIFNKWRYKYFKQHDPNYEKQYIKFYKLIILNLATYMYLNLPVSINSQWVYLVNQFLPIDIPMNRLLSPWGLQYFLRKQSKIVAIGDYYLFQENIMTIKYHNSALRKKCNILQNDIFVNIQN